MSPANKDLFREIKNSFSRFLSILLIVGLGVFVLVGLLTSGLVMRRTVDARLHLQNAQDVQISSMVGLNDTDMQILDRIPGIAERENIYQVELKDTEQDELFQIQSLPRQITLPEITEGRTVQNPGEILLDEELRDRYAIGDTISFQKETPLIDLGQEDQLNQYQFTVVGFANSVSFIDRSNRGESSQGLGQLYAFGYILSEHFQGDPALVRLRFEDTIGLNVSSEKYKDLVQAHVDELKKAYDMRGEERLVEIRGDLQDGIRDGEEKIADAKQKLADGQKKLDDAEQEILNGHTDLQKGESTFREESIKGKNTLDQAQKKLQDALEDLKKGKNELQAGEQALAEKGKSLSDAGASLENGKLLLDRSRQELSRGEAQYAEGKKRYDANQKLLAEGRAQLEEGQSRYAAGLAQYEDGLRQLEEGESAWKQGHDRYAAGLAAYQSGRAQYDAALAKYQSQKKAYDDDQSAYQAEVSRVGELKKQYEEALANAGPNPPDDVKQALETQYQELTDAQKALDVWKAKREQAAKALDEAKKELDVQKQVLDQTEQTLAQAKKELDAKRLLLDTSKKQLQETKAALDSAKETLDQKQKELEKGEAQLKNAEQALSRSKAKLDDGRKQLETSEALYQKNLALYEAGQKLYQEGAAKLSASRAALESGRKSYESGLLSYQEGRSSYADEIAQGRTRLEEARIKLQEAEKKLAEGRETFARESADADQKIADGTADLKEARDALNSLSQPRYSADPFYKNANLDLSLTSADRIDALALVFPVFFFLIAMLVTFTTMTRMVEENRTSIGTYKALGYPSSVIAKKYFVYGALASILGGIIGAIVGSTLLPAIIGNAYNTKTIFFHKLLYRWYPGRILFSIALGFLFSAGTALATVLLTLRENTASLLRLKPPKQGNRIFLERIRPLWKRMGFLSKVTARNLFRYKGRMIMTVIGIAGCTALLILGFGIEGSVKGLASKNFHEILHYNLAVTYWSELDEDAHQQYLHSRENAGVPYESVLLSPLNFTTPDGIEQTANLIAVDDDHAFPQFFTLQERTSGKSLSIPGDGVLINEKMANLNRIHVGDSITFEDMEGKKHTVPVRGIFEQYLMHTVILNKNYYEQIFGKTYKANTDLFLAPTQSSELSKQFRDYRSVVSTADINEAKSVMNAYLISISKVQVIITLASALLAMIVLYNLTNINIQERMREISSIKVLGFYPLEVTTYIFRETALLTLFGIFIGCFLGKALHYVVLQIITPYFLILDPVLTWSSYAISIGITAGVTVLIALIFHYRLKHINMVEALKGNE